MFFGRVVVYVFAVVSLLCVATANAGLWRRESPRAAVADISSTNGLWCISVGFVPVTSFDADKNLLENHRMAEMVARWGLLRELQASSSQKLEISGLEKISFSVGRDFAKAEFSVPTKGVRLVLKDELLHKNNASPVQDNVMPEWPASVTNAKISDKEIESILRKYPFFVETGGAKLLHLEDGRILMVAVGMTDAAKSKIARQTVAESKARAALVSEVNGIKVFAEKRLDEKSVSTVSEKGEACFEIVESQEKVKSKSSGKIQSLEIIGTWELKSENLFCLAIGRIIPENEVHNYVTNLK